MRKIYMFVLSFLIFLAACQPSDSQPVFSTSPESGPTPMSIPTAAPRRVAILPGVIWSFEISPDGSTIAFSTSKGLLLYDLKTFELVRALAKDENVFSLAWSPDGTRLAGGILADLPESEETAGGKAMLKVWDVTAGQVVFEPEFGVSMFNERILDLAFSPDGKNLAMSSDVNGVMTMAIETGNVISHQQGYAGSVMEIAWSPDGSRLVSTGDMAYSVRRWKVSTGESVRLFDRRASNPMHVAWMPDGRRIVSGHVGGAVCFWTAATNRCDGFIHAHRSAVFSMALSPDGSRLATGGGVLRIWDTQTGKLLSAFGLDERIIYTDLGWISAGQTLAALQSRLEDAEQTAVRLWNMNTGAPLVEFAGGKR